MNKSAEQIIAELRADGVEYPSFEADLRNAEAYIATHPEEFANRETLMEMGQRLIREKKERLVKKRRSTK